MLALVFTSYCVQFPCDLKDFGHLFAAAAAALEAGVVVVVIGRHECCKLQVKQLSPVAFLNSHNMLTTYRSTARPVACKPAVQWLRQQVSWEGSTVLVHTTQCYTCCPLSKQNGGRHFSHTIGLLHGRVNAFPRSRRSES